MGAARSLTAAIDRSSSAHRAISFLQANYMPGLHFA
jgi:hypothetical protein